MDQNEIVYQIVSALAEAEGVTPLELDYVLADYIDPAMLEKVVSREYYCELTFQVPNHEVSVGATGEITIDAIPVQQRRTSHSPVADQTDFTNHAEYRSLQRFFDNLPCTVYKSRNEAGWPIEFISENCRDLTGYDPNAFVVGGVNFGFDLIHPDDRDRVSQVVSESIRHDEPFSLQYRILTADDEEKPVREFGRGLVGEDIEPIPIVGVVIEEADLPTDQWNEDDLTETDAVSQSNTD